MSEAQIGNTHEFGNGDGRPDGINLTRRRPQNRARTGLVTPERSCREITCLPIASEDPEVAQNGNLEGLFWELHPIAHIKRPGIESHDLTTERARDGAGSFVDIERELTYELCGTR